MIKHNLSLLLFVLLLVTNNLLAQKKEKGQLITSSGDTTEIYMLTDHGYSNKDILRYKKIEQSTVVYELAPEDVVSFSSDKFYLKVMNDVNNEEKGIFYKVLLLGDGSLFSAENEEGVITFYSLKKGEKIKEIPKDNYIDFLKENFQTCQAVVIRRKPYYEPYYLKNVIVSYNACINPKKYTYYKTRRDRDAYFGLGVGAGPMFFSLIEEPYINISNTTMDYTLTAFRNVELNRVISVQLEVSYSKRGVDSGKGKFSGNYILVPIIAQISFRPNDFEKKGLGNFYFNIGPIFGDMLKGSYDTSGSEWDVLFARDSRISIEFTSGYLLGVGTFLKTDKNLFKLEIRYEEITSRSNLVGFETGGNPDFENIAFKTSSINLNFSYIFK